MTVEATVKFPVTAYTWDDLVKQVEAEIERFSGRTAMWTVTATGDALNVTDSECAGTLVGPYRGIVEYRIEMQ